MGRPSLGKDDYESLAESKNLQHIGDTPYTTLDKTEWVCLHCGKHMTKSYHAVSITEVGCRCQSSNTLTPDDYYALAKERGLVWSGKRSPNSTTETEWTTRTGKTVLLSYFTLKHKLTKKLRDMLQE